MTHVEELLGLALGGIFTNGLWAGRAKDKCPTPYGVFLYFGPTNNYLSGPGSLQNKTVQIDCWDSSVAGAEALADAVEARMAVQREEASPSMFTSTQISRQLAPPDPDVRIPRVILEFSIWFRP